MQNITIHHFFVLCLYDCPEWIKFWAVFALLSPPCQGGNGCGARIVQLEKCLPSITRDDEDVDKNHVDNIVDDGDNDDEGDGDVMWIWGLHSTGWVVVPLIKHSNLRLQVVELQQRRRREVAKPAPGLCLQVLPLLPRPKPLSPLIASTIFPSIAPSAPWSRTWVPLGHWALAEWTGRQSVIGRLMHTSHRTKQRNRDFSNNQNDR